MKMKRDFKGWRVMSEAAILEIVRLLQVVKAGCCEDEGLYSKGDVSEDQDAGGGRLRAKGERHKI
jgi:hypothetical protein